MAIKLVINGRDYSTWIQPFGEAGQFDPVDSPRIQPQFAGAPALSEGGVFVADAVDKRHWQLQLLLKPSPLTVDAAHLLVTAIQQDLYQGAQVEYAPEGASNSSFFDLLSGEFRPTYTHALLRNSRVPGVLELFTKPYATTGTTRTIASQAATAPGGLLATGILGDVDALANLRFTFPSGIANTGNWMVGYGVKYPQASFNPIRLAASMVSSQTGAAILGASGVIGSQYLALGGASDTFAAGGAANDVIPATADYVGRHRVFGVFRHTYSGGSRVLSAVLRTPANQSVPIGTAYITAGGGPSAYQLVDLGEVTFAASSATQVVGLSFGAAGGSRAGGSPGFALNALIYLPLERSAGLVVGSNTASARDQVIVQSYPSAGAARNASDGLVLMENLSGAQRGGAPRLPPLGSPAASGAAHLTVIAAPTGDVFDAYHNGPGGLNFEVGVQVRERFSFFR